MAIEMPGRGERSYAYAKACGITGKSFTGKRAEALRTVSRLSELDRLVFPDTSRDLPEKELLSDLEKRFVNRDISGVTSVLKSFPKLPLFFSLLIRSYEYADVKTALNTVPGAAKPVFTGLGRFGTVDFSAWPDFHAMFRGTEFSFLLTRNGELDRSKSDNKIQAELDRRYYTNLWNSLKKLSRNDRRVSEHILSEEISLRNAAWAMRLRTYYLMKKDEVISHLIDINTPLDGKMVSLAKDALTSLEFPLDSRQTWDNWKRARFLNPDASNWRADPRFFQNAASRYLYRLARRSFRIRPSSLDSIFCFIKIKQFEEDILTSSAEGLALGMSGGDISGILGAES